MPDEIDNNMEDGLDDVLDEGKGQGESQQQKKEGVGGAPNDDLRSAMAELAGTVKTLAAPKPEKEPEFTQEQKNEFWAVYDPEKSNKDFMKKWFRLNPEATQEEIDEVKGMWKGVQEGLVKQAVVGSRNLMQIELTKRDERLAKLEEYYGQQQAKETRARFTEKYPALSDARYAKVLTATAKDLSSGEYKDEASFFKALAEGAAETIKGIIPEFDLGATQTTTKKSAGTSPRLPRTSVGGTGGTGGGKQGALSVKGDATDEFLDED